MKYPRSPQEKIQGIVYFGRMIDKMRLMNAGELHPDLHANLGIGFDERCVNFLGVRYDDLAGCIKAGLTDNDAMTWCLENGDRPTEEQIEIWNAFMAKRGWNDEATSTLIRRKKESGLEERDEIQTMFDYINADEGRPISPKIVS